MLQPAASGGWWRASPAAILFMQDNTSGTWPGGVAFGRVEPGCRAVPILVEGKAILRNRLALAVIVGGLIVASACGGGGNGSALSSTYLKTANGLCDEWTRALKDLGDPPPLGDVAQTAVWTKRLVEIDTKFTERYKALPTTPSEQEVLQPVHAGFDTINDAEAATVSAAERGDRAGIQTFRQAGVDETSKLDVRLKQLRLKSCAD